MIFMRRRPLARAAMIGGTAYVAGKAGARAGANQAQEQQQQQYEQAPPPPPQAGGAMSEDAIDQLTKLAQLHEQGVLTDAEFEVQKQKLLQGM
jgi:alpha/beta superfamily hydrolase